MKIIYSIQSLGNSGGIERVLSTKANYLADVFNYEVHIVVASKKTDSFFYHFSDKIHFHFLNIQFPKRKIWNYIFNSIQDNLYKNKLEQILISEKPDITISVFGLDVKFLYKLNDGSQKILEFHFTKNYLQYLGNSLLNDKYRFLRKFWLKFLQKREEYFAGKYKNIVVLTERDKLLWGNSNKFKVIPNSLSFETDKIALLDNKIILSMGRLVYPKGFQYLIKAFSILKDKYPDWKLLIYGEGQDKVLFQNEINRLSLQNQIIIKSPEENVEKIMLNASFFVLPSLYEGFGLVLVEAMECGLPCIAFDCECGPAEIISNNEDGFLVELKNVETLADKIEFLMKNEMQRKAMGALAKKNAAKFSTEHIMKVWKEYFEQIVKAR